MTHKAEALFEYRTGPFGTIRTCRLCGEFDMIPRGRGRGYGMKYGNKSRGRMIQHVKAEHPDELARVPDNWFHPKANWHWTAAKGDRK